MAYVSMIRRASSTLLPVARRAMASPRSLRGTISTVLSVEKRFTSEELLGRNFVPCSRFFSTNKPAIDNYLIQILESEIECNEPDAIIEEIPEEKKIRLIRKFPNETIEVEVDMDAFGGGGENDEFLEKMTNILIDVKISKENGEKIEFEASLNPEFLDIIGKVSIKNPQNPEGLLAFGNSHLRWALREYLKIRGIKPSLANFFYGYLNDKDHNKYVQWLKNFKSFVEN